MAKAIRTFLIMIYAVRSHKVRRRSADLFCRSAALRLRASKSRGGARNSRAGARNSRGPQEQVRAIILFGNLSNGPFRGRDVPKRRLHVAILTVPANGALQGGFEPSGLKSQLACGLGSIDEHLVASLAHTFQGNTRLAP